MCLAAKRGAYTSSMGTRNSEQLLRTVETDLIVVDARAGVQSAPPSPPHTPFAITPHLQATQAHPHTQLDFPGTGLCPMVQTKGMLHATSVTGTAFSVQPTENMIHFVISSASACMSSRYIFHAHPAVTAWRAA